jgi:hypothetical protein
MLHKKWESTGYAWELQLVDPASGELRGLIPVPGSPTLVRLIGWSADGDPVIVTYEGPYEAMYGGPGNVILSGFEGTVGVARLSRGQAHILVQPNDRINFIDATEELLADPRTRPGDPPWALPPFDRGTASILSLLISVAVPVAAWVLVNRRPRDVAPTATHSDVSPA